MQSHPSDTFANAQQNILSQNILSQQQQIIMQFYSHNYPRYFHTHILPNLKQTMNTFTPTNDPTIFQGYNNDNYISNHGSVNAPPPVNVQPTNTPPVNHQPENEIENKDQTTDQFEYAQSPTRVPSTLFYSNEAENTNGPQRVENENIETANVNSLNQEVIPEDQDSLFSDEWFENSIRNN